MPAKYDTSLETLTARPTSDAKPIPLGSDLRMPDGIWTDCELSVAGKSYFITVRAEPIAGRYEATRVEIERGPESPAVNADVLRRIPIQGIVQLGVAYVVAPSYNPEWGWSVGGGTTETISLEELARSGGRAGPSDDLLREVANVYEAAYLLNRGTTLEVEKQFKVSRPTATRWVAEAKRRGFITVEGD